MYKFLEKCIVRLVDKNNKGGTGFFIGPGLIITCAHVLTENDCSKINAYWEKKECAVVSEPLYYNSDIDVAIIKTELLDTPFVLLDEKVELGSPLYSFGYPDTNLEGEPVTLEYEGETTDAYPLLKLKNGQIRPGMSGAPLLNIDSGTVCGIIKKTRNRDNDLGGKAIPVSSVFGKINQIFDFHKDSSKIHTDWMNLLSPVQKVKLGLINDSDSDFVKYEKNNKKSHFLLFQHDPKPCTSIFIEPNYSINFYKGLEPQFFNEKNDFLNDCLSILHDQKILFILGPYGCGKTFLSKYLQSNLKKKYDTIFVRCCDITRLTEYRSFLNEAMKMKHKNKDIYFIFDSYDEINFIKEDKVDINDAILKNIIELSKEDGIYIILNSRNIFKREEDVFLSICFQMYEFDYNEFKFIDVKYFTKEQINNWLDTYSNEMAKIGKENRLYAHDIKYFHKNLINACHNPLFLYLLVSHYYENGMDSMNDVYSLYESFVDKTVLGKFKLEKPGGPDAIREISGKYREFLRELSITIGSKHPLKIYNDELNEGELLDKNAYNYIIGFDEFEGKIIEITKEVLEKKNIDKERLTENALSCYFLEQSGLILKFRDNNILFFLIAETYFLALKEMCDKYKVGGYSSELYDIIDKYHNIKLHPLTIELLFSRLKNVGKNESETEERKERKTLLLRLIKEFIYDGKVLNITEESLQCICISKINSDLLLCLIYMNINTEGYRDLGYFFKRLYWYLSAAKLLDMRYLNVVRRFFKDIRLTNAELRRINYNGYNFKNSRMNSVKFVQSMFYDVIMQYTAFNEAEFELCEFNDVDMTGTTGSAIFSNCIIHKNVIKETKNISFLFKRCHIKSMGIHNSNKDIYLVFENCDIDDLIIRHSDFRNVDITNCTYNTIKLEGSKGNVYIKKSNCKGGHKYSHENKNDILVMEDGREI